MTSENLQRANEIKLEIATLQAEVEAMEPYWKTGEYFKRCFKKIIGRPIEKTYENYYCSDNLSCIGKVIIIYPDEVKVLRELKLQKIELLRKELHEL